MTTEKRISTFQKEFEPRLTNFFKQKITTSKTQEEKHVWKEMKNYTLAGGKRIRPFILWQMLEKKRAKLTGLSDILIAFELLHNSTLIEDDIIDQHTIRRHKPTLPVSLQTTNIKGDHITLIAAGLMRCASLRLITQANIPSRFKKDCIEAYTEIAESVNRGQVLDLYWTKKLNVTEKNRLTQTENVAARFIEYMFRLGVQEKILQDMWANIGLHFGIIFQLVDDLFDIDKNKNKGRPIGDDIRLGKTTPLIIFTYKKLSPKDKKRFKKNFGDQNIRLKELKWTVAMCQTTGATDHIKELIAKELSKLNLKLSSINVGEKNWVNEFKKFSVERIA